MIKMDEIKFEEIPETEMFQVLEKWKNKNVVLTFSDGEGFYEFKGEVAKISNSFIRLRNEDGERGYNLKFLVRGKVVD